MEIGIKVGDIMTRDFISVKPDTSIKDCARIMIKKKVGSLILQENKKLKGLLTERDIIWALTKKSAEELKEIKAKDLAKRKIITTKPSADLYNTLQKMGKSNCRWLPVTVNSNVIGLITLKDILRIERGLFEIAQAHRSFKIREEKEKLRRTYERKSMGKRDGICEECGNFDFLQNIDGRMICEGCSDSM